MPHSIPKAIPHDDLEILCLGPSFTESESKIVPTVIYFSLTANDSLSMDPYNQPTLELHKNPLVRILSITLPLHGELSPDAAIAAWGSEMEQGRNVLLPFIHKAAGFIEDLKKQKLLHEDHIGLMGLSRGGWIACQVAAQTKVKAVVGFAPVTRFSKSKHFTSSQSQAKFLDLEHIADELTNTSLSFWISNRDVRVGTHNCFEFVETLVEKSFEKGIRSPPVFLHLTPPIGAQGHGTSKESFIAGAQWLLKQILL